MFLEVVLATCMLAGDGQTVADWLREQDMSHCVVEAMLRHRQSPEDVALAAQAIASDLRELADPMLQQHRQAQGEAILGELNLLLAAELELELASSAIRTMHRAQWMRRLGKAEQYVPATSSFSSRRIKLLIRDLERRRDQLADTPGAGTAAVAIARRDEMVAIDRLIRRAWSLNGWARLLESIASGDIVARRNATESFARVLELPANRLSPKYASLDLRRDPTVARSMLGLALVESATDRHDAALEWIQAATNTVVPDVVRAEAARWHVFVAAAAGRFDLISREIEQSAEDDPDLLVLAALESCAQSTSEATQVVSTAIGRLHELQDLERLRLVARRCPLVVTGPLAALAEALAAWDQALERDAQPEAWREVAVRMAEAGNHASSGGTGLPNTYDYQLGWAWRKAGEAIEAAAAYVASADAGFQVDECLALAIDAMAEAQPSSPRLIELLERSVHEQPSGRWWRRHVLQLASLSGRLGPDVMDRLLAIPSTDPDRALIDQALEVVAWYQVLQQPEVPEVLASYVRTVMPILLESSDPAQVRLVAARVASVSLALGSGGVDDCELALNYAQEVGVVDTSVELRSLRARWHAQQGDLVQAESDARAAMILDRSDPAVKTALREIVFAARDDLTDEDVLAAVAAALAMPLGEVPPNVRAQIGMLASMMLRRNPRDTVALQLLEGVLELGKGSSELLIARAGAASAQQDWHSAVLWWQRANHALPATSDAWFRSRYEGIYALSFVDLPRATAAARQHVGLYPTGGPSPWGELLLRLEADLAQGDAP